MTTLKFWTFANATIALACACSHHVRLQAPDTSPGARYSCDKKSDHCQPATQDVPSDLNPHGVSFVKLPRQCQGHIHQIVILDADSDDPKVDVTCAPIEQPIEEMK